MIYSKRIAQNTNIGATKAILKEFGLNTVCESALCPNLNDCFSRRFATFLILGPVCTRRCGFCSVSKGAPAAVDDTEAPRIGKAAAALGLKHIVITSVTRDDLADGGAGEFAKVTKAVKGLSDGITVELLVPDFGGDERAVMKVIAASPDIVGHNIETVERLYPLARTGADYKRSLSLLKFVKDNSAGPFFVKSGIMVGLGEEKDEVLDTIKDIRGAGCDILTIGQYLRPCGDNLPVKRFVAQDEFRDYERYAKDIGFERVYSGPFVRSSNGGMNDGCYTAAIGGRR